MVRLLILCMVLVVAATACGQDGSASTRPPVDRDAPAPVVDNNA